MYTGIIGHHCSCRCRSTLLCSTIIRYSDYHNKATFSSKYILLIMVSHNIRMNVDQMASSRWLTISQEISWHFEFWSLYNYGSWRNNEKEADINLAKHGLVCHVILQWRHSEHDCVSNYRRLDCLLNRFFFRRESKKTSKLHVTGLCEGNPPVTGGFP